MIQLLTLDPADWTDYQVSRKDGQTEHWRIRHFTVSEDDLGRYRHIADGRDTGVGNFVALDFRAVHPRYQDGEHDDPARKSEWRIMMSDTQSEIVEHLEFMDKVATWQEFGERPAEVLIAGLGLGMVAEACAKMGANVTVLDPDPEVIALVINDLPDNVRVIQADAFTWQADQTFDLAWYDIWPTISPANLGQMRQLKRRYRRHVTTWQGCWAWEHCLFMQRSLRTDPFEFKRTEQRQRRLHADMKPGQMEELFAMLNKQQKLLAEVNALKAQGKEEEAAELLRLIGVELEIEEQTRARKAELKARLAQVRETAQTGGR